MSSQEMALKKLPAKRSRKGITEEGSNVVPQADTDFNRHWFRRWGWRPGGWGHGWPIWLPWRKLSPTVGIAKLVIVFITFCYCVISLGFDIICFLLFHPLWLNWACRYCFQLYVALSVILLLLENFHTYSTMVCQKLQKWRSCVFHSHAFLMSCKSRTSTVPGLQAVFDLLFKKIDLKNSQNKKKTTSKNEKNIFD